MNPEPPSALLLRYHLKVLKLPTMLRDYAAVAAACGTERIDYAGFLLRLAERELLERERSHRTTDQGGGVPGDQDNRHARLHRPAFAQRELGARTVAGRGPRSQGERALGRRPRHGQAPLDHPPQGSPLPPHWSDLGPLRLGPLRRRATAPKGGQICAERFGQLMVRSGGAGHANRLKKAKKIGLGCLQNPSLGLLRECRSQDLPKKEAHAKGYHQDHTRLRGDHSA
jgi:hypothetical protein